VSTQNLSTMKEGHFPSTSKLDLCSQTLDMKEGSKSFVVAWTVDKKWLKYSNKYFKTQKKMIQRRGVCNDSIVPFK